MAKPSGLPPRPKGERSIAKARFDGTRQITRRSCAHLQKIDTEKDAAGGSLQTLTTGFDFLLGNTWEQDQEQDACLPAYRPLENKTERQTVSSARREQGPRAAHQTIAFTRTRQRDKRSHRRAGNKDPERCSPNDRKRCRIRDRSHYAALCKRLRAFG